MSINVPWLEVLKACYPNAQVMVMFMVVMSTMVIMMAIIAMMMMVVEFSFFCEQMSEDTEVLVVSPQYNADIAVIMVSRTN